MTKKTYASSQDFPTELIKDKEEFRNDLQKRVSIGEEIFENPIDISDRFSEWNDYNNEYLKQAYNKPINEYRSEYDDAGYTPFGSMSKYSYGTLEERKDALRYKINALKKLLNKVDLMKSQVVKETGTLPPVESNKSNEIFIVHGHDELAKTKVARFIEKLGLRPIILHEQASAGKTIIEKIEEHSNVGFGIVLYTPCDIGGKVGASQSPRARQNVVFEHGFLIGRIGRRNVSALVKGDLETPNDISGIVYVTMDDADAWHIQIAKELKSSGYDIDMNKVF